MNDPLAPAPAHPREPAPRPFVAIGLMLIAVALFSLMDSVSKLLAQSYSPLEVAWGRYVAIFLLLLPFVLRNPRRMLRVAWPGLQLVRAITVMGSALLFIAGLQFLPLAEATAIAFTSPLLVTAMSIPFLGERVGPRRWASVVVGFLGVLVVIRPGTRAFDPAALLPLGSAAFWAMSIVATRRMGSRDRPITTLFFSTSVGLVLCSAAMPLVWITPTPEAIFRTFLVAMLSAGGQYLVIIALMRAAASLIMPFSYSQMLWSILLGYQIFGTIPATNTWIGATIIIGSGLYIAHRERVTSKRRAGSAP
ncbi:MAG TPA: DMT family transporter [Stellaceae bacterium]|nr:DMT family transporter [Stellaceae bacterium]